MLETYLPCAGGFKNLLYAGTVMGTIANCFPTHGNVQQLLPRKLESFAAAVFHKEFATVDHFNSIDEASSKQ